MQQIISNLIEQYQPLAIFLGGSRGDGLPTEKSDTDLILFSSQSQSNFKEKNYHICISDMTKTLRSAGLLFMENLLYVKNDNVKTFFQNNLKSININNLWNNLCFKRNFFGSYSHHIVAFYNYYYDTEELLDIRHINFQNHTRYYEIMDTLKKDYPEPSVEVNEKLIENYNLLCQEEIWKNK